MVRVVSGILLLAATVALLVIGIYGIYALMFTAGAIALWEFRRLSDRWGYRAPSWLLYPLGLFFALSVGEDVGEIGEPRRAVGLQS